MFNYVPVIKLTLITILVFFSFFAEGQSNRRLEISQVKGGRTTSFYISEDSIRGEFLIENSIVPQKLTINEQKTLLLKELLNTSAIVWGKLAFEGKNCANCDTGYGASIQIVSDNTTHNYWIRNIGRYPKPFDDIADKLFAVFWKD